MLIVRKQAAVCDGGRNQRHDLSIAVGQARLGIGRIWGLWAKTLNGSVRRAADCRLLANARDKRDAELLVELAADLDAEAEKIDAEEEARPKGD